MTRKTIWMVALVAAVALGGTARAADKTSGKDAKAAKAGTGSCTFVSTGACWENYVPEMCATGNHAPGAACPTANRVGTCKTNNRVMRLYTDKYTEQNAMAYCQMLSGTFEKG
jgi:hypothetical protein